MGKVANTDNVQEVYLRDNKRQIRWEDDVEGVPDGRLYVLV